MSVYWDYVRKNIKRQWKQASWVDVVQLVVLFTIAIGGIAAFILIIDRCFSG